MPLEVNTPLLMFGIIMLVFALAIKFGQLK